MLFRAGRVPLFSFLVLVKVIIIRMHIFPLEQQLPAVLFELASLVVIFGIIDLLSPRRSISTFLIADCLLTFFLISTVMYYNHFGRLLDYSTLSQFPLLRELGASILALLSYSYLLFFVDIIIIAKLRWNLNKKNRALLTATASNRKKAIPMTIASLALILSLFTLYQPKDNSLLFAQEVGMFNAQVYQSIKALGPEDSDPLPSDALHKANIEKLKQIKPTSWPKYFGAARNKNLILVQLESTENFIIGLSINGQEITPHLNKLIKESLYFPFFYSQIGQGNTSDAEFITNTSIYPQARGTVSNDFIGIDFPSLPRLLRSNGYTTLTFHANDITFWNRDNLYPCLGFNKYFDKSFYQNEDLVGPWGSSDEILFKKAIPILKELNNKNRKFYASLITLSCHHPFTLPQSKIHLTLPNQLQNTLLGNYLTAVNYEDYALGLFIQELKDSGLWDNSMIVVFGDHYGIPKHQEKENRELFASILGRERDPLDTLNVPLIIKIPGVDPSIIATVGGQIDLFPTIANLMGIYLEDHIIFGQDILNQETNLLGFRFYYPEGTFISSDIFYIAGRETGLKIDTHEPVNNRDFFAREQSRILSLLKLSDMYLEELRKAKELSAPD